MFDAHFLKRIHQLQDAGRPYVLALVVRFEKPISGKPGDKALILEDGSLHGWVGGGCTAPIVIEESKKALMDGKPRLLQISPNGTAVRVGMVNHAMTCHSGGTLEIYLEPVLPKPMLVVLGRSPVGQALLRLGAAMDYRLAQAAPDADRDDRLELSYFNDQDYDLAKLPKSPRIYAVVSTQGEDDEGAMEAALAARCDYIAFVASRRKKDAVLEYLGDKGVSCCQLKKIKAPAGLDIGARTPDEIAVSILAEIVQTHRAFLADSEAHQENQKPTAVDPVCQMDVVMEGAKHTHEHAGTTWYFCRAGCKRKFAEQPEKYLQPNPKQQTEPVA